MPNGFDQRVSCLLVCFSALVLTACSGAKALTQQDTAPRALPSSVRLAEGAERLSAPVLSFNDTGLSVSDGVTRNGLWDVESAGLGWEFSLDQGASWSRGVGQSFEVKDDGPQMIWVRARDYAGNTSKIVRVPCVLDTMAPAVLTVSAQPEGNTHILKLSGLEPGAHWEYSLDQQATWRAGQGAALALLGNMLTDVRLRQVDLAGNASEGTSFDAAIQSRLAHEASDNPALPSVLTAGAHTHVIHGWVARDDTDHVTWQIPPGHRLISIQQLELTPKQAKAILTLQTGRAFGVGAPAARTRPQDLLGREEGAPPAVPLATSPPGDERAMRLRIEHPRGQALGYAIEVVLAPVD
jgi:hypothetical protein